MRLMQKSLVGVIFIDVLDKIHAHSAIEEDHYIYSLEWLE